MAKLYAPDGRFKDPAFGELSGAEAGDMWRMLTGRSEDLRVDLAEHSADGGFGDGPLDRHLHLQARVARWSTTSRPGFAFETD